MKFLCDRCKTRYSIGDERVRGKILKIRCKNCANVITVREGMAADDPADQATADSRRAKKATTMAPMDMGSVPASNGALGAAFANAMTKPPPALEEEWYVSIDGEQAGPFSLADAQRWVATKPPEADLHCWSEGFDDWLPIDKVSHFRGLRKRAAPPPAPVAIRSGGASGPVRSPAPATMNPIRPSLAGAAPVEDEPKPLFAATMASLERSTTGSSTTPIESPRGLGLGTGAASTAGLSGAAERPSASNLQAPGRRANPSAGPATSRATPVPVAARTNGSAATRASALPSVTSVPQGTPSSKMATVRGLGSNTGPITGQGAAVGAAAVRPIFDPADLGDSNTAIESVPFPDEANTAAEPAAAAAGARTKDRSIGSVGAGWADKPRTTGNSSGPVKMDAASPHMPATSSSMSPGAGMSPAPSTSSASEIEDDSLDIGEVSRVVKLADLMRPQKPKQTTTQLQQRRSGAVPMNQTGPVGRMSGNVPRLNTGAGLQTGTNPMLGAVPMTSQQVGEDGLPIPLQEGDPGEHGEHAVAPAVSHKRGMIALAAGAVLLLGIVGAVVLIVMSTEDGGLTHIGRVGEIDTTRPNDPQKTGKDAPVPGTAATPAKTSIFLVQKPPRPHHTQLPGPPTGNTIRPDEIEAKARDSGEMTKRCYMRAQRGQEGVLFGDLKKINVTLTISPEGSVTTVGLGGIAGIGGSNLEKCLVSQIRAWRFRVSPGGTYRISLVFG